MLSHLTNIVSGQTNKVITNSLRKERASEKKRKGNIGFSSQASVTKRQ